jgi:hypothetical protein
MYRIFPYTAIAFWIPRIRRFDQLSDYQEQEEILDIDEDYDSSGILLARTMA